MSGAQTHSTDIEITIAVKVEPKNDDDGDFEFIRSENTGTHSNAHTESIAQSAIIIKIKRFSLSIFFPTLDNVERGEMNKRG